ncbi:hypothetical protein L1887_59819 [Cichorium endivia]|nr:hypothetical protein L1887_59819 [Cichorium endivia]
MDHGASLCRRSSAIVFYASSNMKDWSEVSRFQSYGILGYQYECPDLFQVPVEGGPDDGKMMYVLAISINPGAPIGGSFVQYWVGDWGRHQLHAPRPGRQDHGLQQGLLRFQQLVELAGQQGLRHRLGQQLGVLAGRAHLALPLDPESPRESSRSSTTALLRSSATSSSTTVPSTSLRSRARRSTAKERPGIQEQPDRGAQRQGCLRHPGHVQAACQHQHHVQHHRLLRDLRGRWQAERQDGHPDGRADICLYRPTQGRSSFADSNPFFTDKTSGHHSLPGQLHRRPVRARTSAYLGLPGPTQTGPIHLAAGCGRQVGDRGIGRRQQARARRSRGQGSPVDLEEVPALDAALLNPLTRQHMTTPRFPNARFIFCLCQSCHGTVLIHLRCANEMDWWRGLNVGMEVHECMTKRERPSVACTSLHARKRDRRDRFSRQDEQQQVCFVRADSGKELQGSSDKSSFVDTSDAGAECNSATAVAIMLTGTRPNPDWAYDDDGIVRLNRSSRARSPPCFALPPGMAFAARPDIGTVVPSAPSWQAFEQSCFCPAFEPISSSVALCNSD